MDIFDQLGDIPGVADFQAEPAPEPPQSNLEHVTRVIRKQFCEHFGLQWLHATIEQHTMPDGRIAYTIARKCVRCRGIHTFIVFIKEDGTLDVAAPMENA